MMHDTQKSDSGVVPRKAANQGARVPAESLEGRAGIERNPGGGRTDRMQRRGSVSQGAERIRQFAARNPQEKLTALLHHVSEEALGKAHDALDALPVGIEPRKVNWILDADVAQYFDFLGFTHYCGRTRQGRFQLGRKPIAKRMSRQLKGLQRVLLRNRHADPKDTARWLGQVLNGWLNYYADPGSHRFLARFRERLKRIWARTGQLGNRCQPAPSLSRSSGASAALGLPSALRR